MRQPILEAKGISKAFGHVQALDNVDFELYPAEVVALIGDNGAGKSTLVKILSGIYRKDSGQIYFEGRPIELRGPKDAERLAGISRVQPRAFPGQIRLVEVPEDDPFRPIGKHGFRQCQADARGAAGDNSDLVAVIPARFAHGRFSPYVAMFDSASCSGKGFRYAQRQDTDAA